MTPKKALGKGLDALIQRGVNRPAAPPPPVAPHIPSPAPVPAPVAPVPAVPPAPAVPKGDAVLQIEPEKIRANRFQPRTKFEQEALEELVASIREHGIIQPLTVRRAADGQGYELIAG